MLKPTPEVTDVIYGIIGRALHLWPDITLYAPAFLSNHIHLMLDGPTADIPAFIGYIKREVSRRCAPLVGWAGDSMGSRDYWSTALPTAEAQENCLLCIASQSVKEGLVEKPEQWPGVHCAHQLFASRRVTATWLDGTRYGKARYKGRSKPPDRRRDLDVKAFSTTYEVRLEDIPTWAGLSREKHRVKLDAMYAEVVEEGARNRQGKAPRGVAAVLATQPDSFISLPPAPWFEERRRMICWARPSAVETKRYLVPTGNSSSSFAKHRSATSTATSRPSSRAGPSSHQCSLADRQSSLRSQRDRRQPTSPQAPPVGRVGLVLAATPQKRTPGYRCRSRGNTPAKAWRHRTLALGIAPTSSARTEKVRRRLLPSKIV